MVPVVVRIALPSLAHGPVETEHSGIREIGNEAGRTPGAIQLHVGQPNFPTPKHIGEAGKRAIDEGKTFYTHTQGIITLREKLVAKLERVNGIRVTPDRIACTPGGVGAIAAVFAAVLEPGDEVLLPDPGWPNTRIADHAAHQAAADQQPEQPDGRCLSATGHRAPD
ncbi:MAG: aminotransferase class I/II-fold pyridoxal phosphate-dependent enzyme [Chloroflexi bacterium]|nr:MAG: aminotransferase class I/II-fold pyridoxal phosphate-dependent enzyme [Chloroflexota bacterium]